MKKFLFSTFTLSASFFSIPTFAADVHIYAASSMTNVIGELGETFKQQTGDHVIPVYAGSSTLARQIEQGAPADIFISANPKWMQYLADKDFIKQDQAIELVGNSLVLVAADPQKNAKLDPQTFAQLPELLANQRLAIGEPSSVPAGMYAKESLQNLGLWDELQAKTAPSSNVRLSLSLVERGEAPFGIVYKTDALLSKKVTLLQTFPESSHSPIIYPVVALNDHAATQAFYDFLTTETANQAFIKYGFTPLSKATPK